VRILIPGRQPRSVTPRDLQRAKIPKRWWDVAVSGVPKDSPQQRAVKQYIENVVDYLRRGVGIVFTGEHGRGKTSAAVVCAKAAIAHGGRVLYVSGGDLKSVMIEKPEFDEYETVPQRIRSVDLLILDDPDRGGDTTWNRQVSETVLRERSGNGRSTIVCSAIPATDIQRFFGHGAVSLMKESMVWVTCVGPDLRDDAGAHLTKEFDAR